jgi:hypothetical protein
MKLGTALVVIVVLVLGYHFWMTNRTTEAARQPAVEKQTAMRRAAIDSEIARLKRDLESARRHCPDSEVADPKDPSAALFCGVVRGNTARIDELTRQRP